MVVTRLECSRCSIAVEGHFDLPQLGQLSPEEQVFVQAFVRVHGSIKKMEQLFAVSYPTIKNRLTAIGAKLDSTFEMPSTQSEVLKRLSQGGISVEEALQEL